MPPIDFEASVKLLILLGMTGTLIVGLRLLGGWARRISRGPAPGAIDSASREDAAVLREQVDRLTNDVAELQERVDFTERLLARQRDSERLKG